MPNQMIALQARAPRLPTYNQLVAGRDMNLARQNALAIQEQTMQQNAAAQAKAAQSEAAMSNALKLAHQGDIAGAEAQFGLGAGNLAVHEKLTGLKDEQLKQARTRLVAAGAASLALKQAPDEAARKALLTQLAPQLQAAGWTPEQIAGFPLDDQSLTTAITNAISPDDTIKAHMKSQEPYTLAPGAIRYEGATKIAENVAPQGITYVKDEYGRYIPLPTKVGGGDGVGLVGGERGGADAVYGFGKFGAPDKPLSGLSIGEVQNFQRNTLIPATRGKIGAGPDKGTGAVGAYQITYGTLQKYAPKVLGANWRNTPFTPEVQDQIARAIYEDVKGGDLKQTWAGLPSNKPGQYANVPWEQVRDKIIAAETGGRGIEFGKPIPGTGGAKAANKPTTEDERKIASNVKNMVSAAKEMADVVRQDPTAIAPGTGEYIAGQIPFAGEEAARWAQSGARQRFNAALEKILSAVTFINTGAGVSKEQIEGYRRSYFPTLQDTNRTRQSKLLGVIQYIRDAKARAGNAWTPDLDAALNDLQKLFGTAETYKPKTAVPSDKSAISPETAKKYGL